MRDAQRLILDEPTSSLDPQAEYEVFAHFRELTAGKSAIFISHRFSTVRLANRIIVLEDGDVLKDCTSPSFVAKGGRYADSSPSRPRPTAERCRSVKVESSLATVSSTLLDRRTLWIGAPSLCCGDPRRVGVGRRGS